MMCQMQFPFQALTWTLLPQVWTCPLQTLLLHRSTSQCLLELVVSTTTSLSLKLLRIKNTTVSSNSSSSKLLSTRSIRTSRSTISRNTTNRSTTRNTTNNRIIRVYKKAVHLPPLENLPLLETLLLLEMMMTAGRQAKINLRCFGNLGRGQSGHSDKKYATFWLMRTCKLLQ